MLPNLAEDWRFKHSPPVEEGGLRSYAGAQLRCKAENGDDVALGSLCIASNTAQSPLPPAEQATLVRFADMISAEIVNRSRERRKRERLQMSELLVKLQSQAMPDNVETLVRDAIHQIYPYDFDVSIQTAFNNSVTVPGRAPIPLNDLQEGLWEDSDYIDHLIISQNHEELRAAQTVRAIVFVCMTQPVRKYIVVASSKIQFVFDDVDAWFIERCTLLLCNTIQEGRLKEALQVKETFLRGITHQLRTPIHGVLGSCELLAEELASRNLLDDSPLPDAAASNSGKLTASAVLKTIRDSGRELMSTVNNMLKLNRWAEHGGSAQPATLQSLNKVEDDILYDVFQSIPEQDLAMISIMFENQLATDDCMITIDLVLLRECIEALIINALQYTQKGSVIVTISGTSDYSRLRFDVVDTGCGIRPEDQMRIFEAYEKVDTHTRGAGLGLTLAAKITNAINGQVSLVSSQVGYGSHFRADFFDPGFACPIDRSKHIGPCLDAMPKSFHVIPAETERPDLVLHFASYLSHRGFHDSDSPEGCMIIVTYTPDAEEFRKLLASVAPRHVAMTLIPAGAHLENVHGKHELRFFEGPFLSTRLEEILVELNDIYQQLKDNPESGEEAHGTADETEAHRIDEPEGGISPVECNPHVLIVDDNVVNLRIMRMYCDKRQMPHSTAVDGRDAVSLFSNAISENNPFNIVLMDLQMPICDGVDATREIRELEQKSALQPSVIFMVTGQDSDRDMARSFAAGANEFYVKPMSIKTLDKGIKRYFPAFEPIRATKK